MIWKEGGGWIEKTTLFGKYQLCRVVGSGSCGTVYLAYHTVLGEYRAIKRVPKICVDYERFRREALVLKTLRHPGIPMVYDLEEDETYSYLIEEFLEGDSLYALISKEGRFSKAMTIRYGIQICHLVMYLHSARPIPILYLDLQPKNLLLCHDTVKLVDFGQASNREAMTAQSGRYGTAGFAAPEQYTGEALDGRADIYAIGAVLYYMMTAKNPGDIPEINRYPADDGLSRVIEICMRADRTERYASAAELCEKLERLEARFNKNISSLHFAVAGADRGAGATHAAIGLSAYLKKQGIAALYEECNGTDAVRRMAQCLNRSSDMCGIYRLNGIFCKPKYGEAVHLKPHDYKVVISDYGAQPERALEEHADVVFLVYGAKWWERGFRQEILSGTERHTEVVFICNHIWGQTKNALSKFSRGKRHVLMPQFSNPFQVTKETEQFYRQALRGVLQKCGEGWLRNRVTFGTLKSLWRRIRSPWVSQERDRRQE